MYQSDLSEKLCRNSQRISELAGECEFRARRGENTMALRSRISKLGSEQEELGDLLFGPKTIRYGLLHRVVFSSEAIE